MTKHNLNSEYKTCANMIKYIIIHNIYLMNVLNKLCLGFWNLKKAEFEEAGSQCWIAFTL